MKGIFALLFILIFSSVNFGANFIVNNGNDTSDANLNDNLCADASFNCTLRAAVEQANALPSDDVITFALGLQLVTLTTNTEIAISNAGTLQIIGSGANVLTINGGTGAGGNRIFNINSATVTISNLTLTDGGTSEFFSNNSNPNQNGGAILATGGALTLQRVYATGNTAGYGGGPSGIFGSGGAIALNGGTHSIENSTLSNNRSTSGGGAVSIAENTNLTITNSTISNNTGVFSGGGISNGGNLVVRSSTIADNFTIKASGIFNLGYGGGIANNNGTLQFGNTIIAGNTVQNTTQSQQSSTPEIHYNGGTITSLGNNFVGDSAGDSNSTGTPVPYQPSDIRDISPMLAALALNGGVTPTRALLSGSPAINAGNNNAPPTDQRGAPRVGAPDIGAYEFGALLFTISGRVTSDGTNGLSGVTVTLSGSSSASVTTNANGEYSFTGLAEGGNYTVTPTLAGTTFSPLNATFTNLNTNPVANFRPECTYSISPTSATIPASGGTGTINVITQAGCSWTATSNNPTFITVNNASGVGSGTATFTVAANNGAARAGTITVAGQTFTVNQSALPTLSINSISFFEGNSGTTAFNFTVTLSPVSGATVTVNYATVNGTATPPSDYQGVSGTVSFAPGETSKTVIVLVNGDTVVEPNETFTVNLSNPVNALIANAQGIGTIRNDDGVAVSTLFDFDGDRRADVSLFRPSNGNWYILPSQTNGFYGFPFGQAGDSIAPADYDGDGKTDVAVFRDTVPGAGNFAYFYILNSSNNLFRAVQFGATGDVPLSGDWDGDGRGDLAVYRAAQTAGGQSFFYYRPSSQSSVDFNTIPLGTTGDKPLYGDFDGDGRLDPAVFRSNAASNTATWIILKSSLNQIQTTNFGLSTDVPVPADYDGDGLANIAVFRPSNGTWYTNQNPQTNFGAIVFGASGDLPVPADYDGDGRADTAVFRPSNGAWYLNRTTSGLFGVQFGVSGDKPVPNAYIR